MGDFAAIRAVAGYLPPKVEKNDMSERLTRESGVFERHVVTTETACDLAVAAAERLFSQYDIARETIDFVLLCTQQPDYALPTTACLAVHRLGLSKSCGALDYSLGCSGYVYGLAMAKGMVESGLARNLLLLTSSLYSTVVNPKDHTTYPIFGDASSATLVSSVESEGPLLSAFDFGTYGSLYDRLIIPAGGSCHPPRQTPEVFSTDARGNVRSNYEIYMDGQEVMLFTLREVPKLVDTVLGKAGLVRGDLDYCVFHQPNQFMLNYVQRKCQLGKVPFFNDVGHTGNTVAASIPLGIEKVLGTTPGKDLGHVLLAGFGVGLSWAGCVADLRQMLPEKAGSRL